MWTFKLRPSKETPRAPKRSAAGAVAPFRQVVREALLVAVVVGSLTVLLAPNDGGLVALSPHPAWIAVMILAARYGTRGFAVALPAAWAVAAAAGLALEVAPAVIAGRVASGADLGALAASVLVAWVASIHERRAADLHAQMQAALAEQAEAREALTELRGTALALRARTDRLETSLAFLRDVAARLEGGDPLAAGEAALEILSLRTGARAGVLQLAGGRSGEHRTLAWFGAWSADMPMPPAPLEDRTCRAALTERRPVHAIEAGAGPDDADLVAPILAPDGAILGLVALRGVPHPSLWTTLLHEVALVAEWAATPLGRARPDDAERTLPRQVARREVLAATPIADTEPPATPAEPPITLSQLTT